MAGELNKRRLTTILVLLLTISKTTLLASSSHQDPLEKYKAAIDFIVSDQECLKGFLFLIGKRTTRKKLPSRYLSNKLPSIKVTRYLYSGNIKDEHFLCAKKKRLKEERITINDTLVGLSVDNSNSKFLLYFSKAEENYLECTIVKYKKQANKFITNTRFGKVVKVQFCFENNRIKTSKVSLQLAG